MLFIENIINKLSDGIAGVATLPPFHPPGSVIFSNCYYRNI